MATPNINCFLQAVVAAGNNLISPPPQLVNFDFGNPTFPTTVLVFEPFFQVGTVLISPALPASPLFAIAVQNLSLSASVTLTITPAVGTAASFVLGPGSVTQGGDSWIYWCPSKPAGGGIINVGLLASAVGTPIALIMAG